MRNSEKHSRNETKGKKVFILLIGVIIISIVGITIFSGSLKENTVDANAQTVENENENITQEAEVPKEVVLDESGYLPLKKDTNADDASIVLPETMYKWNFYRENRKKTVYLTFDDGPSTQVTNQILDILDANDIKGTFFVLGTSIKGNPKAPETLKRMAKKGHAIANHGYSHDYNILYPKGVIDVQAFINDMDKNLQLLRETLGQDFNTRVLRMPGGYGTWYGVTPLNKALVEKGYYQTDWNCVNGDAEGRHKSPEQQLDRLKETMLDYDTLIVLMHDTNAKTNTVKYLQSSIDYLKSHGFEFKTLK